MAIAAALVLTLGLAAAITTKVKRDHRVAADIAQKANEEKAAATQAAEKKKQLEDAQAAKEATDKVERAQRGALIKDMQKSITKDARKSVKDDILDGPILYTQCTPLGGGSTDDLTAITGTFSCLAATKENNDGTISGYSFSSTANWDEQSYSWHLGN